MNVNRKRWLAAACLAYTPAATSAEARATDPSASAPPVAYRSAFEGYQPYRDQPLADWRALNAEVGVAGGHIGILGGAGGHAGHGGGVAGPAAGKPVTTESGPQPVRGASHSAPGAGKPAGAAHGRHRAP